MSSFNLEMPSLQNSVVSSQDVAVPKNSKHGMMLRFLYRRFLDNGWLQSEDAFSESSRSLGVVMQTTETDSIQYFAEPADVNPDLITICRNLQLNAAFTLSSEICAPIFKKVGKHDQEFTLGPYNLTVPVVDSVNQLAYGNTGVRKRDFMCMIRKERCILVWANNPEDLMNQGADVESKLMGTIWGSVLNSDRPRETFERKAFGYRSGYGTPDTQTQRHTTMYEKDNSNVIAHAIELEEKDPRDEEYLDIDDEEATKIPHRPFLLTHSLMVGLAVFLLVFVESLAVKSIIVEVRTLGAIAYQRFALLATLPLLMFIAMFFFIVLIGCVFQLFGPVQDPKTGNSLYYSSRPPRRERHKHLELPHITIQMPVYKEGLKGVIIPTVTSLLKAIAHYEREGGTASIFVCEDGMQAIKPELAEARQQYYRNYGIGWCARPPHGKDGFVRAGKFKKASNMNYCLSFSIRVEDEMQKLMKAKARETNISTDELTVEQEAELYSTALKNMLEADGGKTWAEGNVRMGEIILLIDCDTRVPEDCLVLGAMEIAESPQVAIVQHASGVMQVVNNVFENAITYFTNLVYLSIRFAVGNGDYAPFVGHNAFLRWRAVQSVSFIDDGVEKFWSDNHVSEDFDISLRLQIAGFVVRLASYDNGEFKEGVSLTVFDELLRWEKYAYGCSELVFHPLKYWIFRGPFTKLFRTFLWSNMKISSKTTILAYIGTYYAIAAALPLSVLNYLLTGWYADDLDHYYMASWKMLVGTLFIFNVVSPIAFAWFRQRMGECNFFPALWEGVKWMPLFMLFFGGMSWHLSKALLCHMFGINIEWSSTAKELESTGFFISMDKVFKTFKWTFLGMVPLIGGMIYLALFAPRGWRINDFTSIVPIANQVGCHILLPLMPAVI